jgi:hypothetical protein
VRISSPSYFSAEQAGEARRVAPSRARKSA